MILQINFFSEEQNSKIKFPGLLSQFNGLESSCRYIDSEKGKEVISSLIKLLTPEKAIASVFLIEIQNEISEKKSYEIATVVYPNGKIIPQGLEYLPEDFIFVKAQNGKHFMFKLKRDKIFERKEIGSKLRKTSKKVKSQIHPKVKTSKKDIFSLSSKAKLYQNWSR